jgi:hypothetical protein
MKRVKQVRSALCSHRRTTTGRTRGIHGVRHAVSSANSLCMSTHRWTALAGMRPKWMPEAMSAPPHRATAGSAITLRWDEAQTISSIAWIDAGFIAT